jgi:hypothetical protein
MFCRIVQPPGQPNGFGSILEVEIVSRDPCGLYAQGAREGARPRRGRSLTDSISCRTCAKRSRPS